MSYDSIIRNGVALANRMTSNGKLQESFTLRRWQAEDDYATALPMAGVVEHKRRAVRTKDGEDSVANATITVLTPIPILAPAIDGRKEPVDERDLLTLADGTTAPILATDGGITDPDTGYGYVNLIYLG